jgi:ABC-2 type transport system permease protein
MNFINKALLNTFLAPKALYRKLDVNTAQLRSILVTKLTMDDRRPSSLIQAQQNRKKPLSTATIGTMVISLVMGFFYLICFLYAEDMTTALTVYFSFFFIMLSASLISDFTSVLIDVRDTFIILPKPVNDRTFVVSRLLHITIHICKIVVPMALPGVVYMVAAHGFIGLLIFLITVILMTLFVLFFINAVYLLILKITTPQKFKSIISYVQIIFAISIYASYQLMPRLMARMELFHTQLSDNPFLLTYPMYWFAAAWKVLSQWQGNRLEWIGAALALLIPISGIWLVIKYLAPSFNNKLAMIQGSGTESGPAQPVAFTSAKKKSYATRLSQWFTNSGVERAGFLFTWKLMTRSRDFKIKVYPAIGYLVVYVVVMFLNVRWGRISDLAMDEAKVRALVVLGLYFSSFLLNIGQVNMVFSEKYKASWVYYVLPVAQPGQLISGGIKAAILMFYIPMALLLSAVGIGFLGLGVLPNLLLGITNQLLISFMIAYFQPKRFPFSVLQQNDQKTGSFLRAMLQLLISAIIGVTHYALYHFTVVILILTVLSGIATWFLAGSLKRVRWVEVRSSYVED